MNIAKRVGALESQAGVGGYEASHRVIQHLGQTKAEAINAYGRDLIEPCDLVVMRVIVATPT